MELSDGFITIPNIAVMSTSENLKELTINTENGVTTKTSNLYNNTEIRRYSNEQLMKIGDCNAFTSAEKVQLEIEAVVPEKIHERYINDGDGCHLMKGHLDNMLKKKNTVDKACHSEAKIINSTSINNVVVNRRKLVYCLIRTPVSQGHNPIWMIIAPRIQHISCQTTMRANVYVLVPMTE